ncbi:hypothetical protein CWT12_11325 [Actinomyces sp. 432]|uniref:hypothetical protein n=1 Tax=Actinomyces sp. 432 TaxID=2057798 RepID=UPI0013743F67|nr:hypothetical protein [Actinomyces sp. 432]QHO91778.1 hypothetical protein CWT12_11325 [Actinomyces sp. 432]
MKTAVSIPDPVFQEAEELARRLGWSRSQLYTKAVHDLIVRYSDDPVTEALNALEDVEAAQAPLTPARKLIESGAWSW